MNWTIARRFWLWFWRSTKALCNRFHLVVVGVGSTIFSEARIWPISVPVRPSVVSANAAAMASSSLCENFLSTIRLSSSLSALRGAQYTLCETSQRPSCLQTGVCPNTSKPAYVGWLFRCSLDLARRVWPSPAIRLSASWRGAASGGKMDFI